MTTDLYQNAEQILENLSQKGLRRDLNPVGVSKLGRTQIDGKEYINFSSNNYMGLAQHPLLIERAMQWTREWGSGSMASRLVCGTMDLHTRIEDKLCAVKGGESALIFNSGFQANAAILSALFDKDLCGEEPLVFCDKLNHASMHQGLKAAGVRQIRYRHNDMNHLEECLRKYEGSSRPRFIVTESVFSMDGDRSPIEDLIDISHRYNAMLYVDEAHATGVLGHNGFGLCAHKDVTFKMGTFSKALGGFGAYLVCPKVFRDYLVNKCAGLIYSTALPPAVLGTMDGALELVPNLTQERKKLLQASETVRTRFKNAGFDVGPSSTQIIPLILQDEVKTLAFSEKLKASGILGVAIRPPTVPKGASRIRFALSAAHQPADIEKLCCFVEEFAHD